MSAKAAQVIPFQPHGRIERIQALTGPDYPRRLSLEVVCAGQRLLGIWINAEVWDGLHFVPVGRYNYSTWERALEYVGLLQEIWERLGQVGYLRVRRTV